LPATLHNVQGKKQVSIFDENKKIKDMKTFKEFCIPDANGVAETNKGLSPERILLTLNY
jgi:hypothetical protein